MNWYKKANPLKGQWFTEEDVEQNLRYFVGLDYENANIGDWEKIELEEQLESILNTFPSGYKVRREGDGWSIALPTGQIVAFNEKTLLDAARGAKARFGYLEVLV